MNRRSLLLGLTAALAAPAIIRTPGLLMPVRTWFFTPVADLIEQTWARGEVLPPGYYMVERTVKLRGAGTIVNSRLHLAPGADFDLRDATGGVISGCVFDGTIGGGGLIYGPSSPI